MGAVSRRSLLGGAVALAASVPVAAASETIHRSERRRGGKRAAPGHSRPIARPPRKPAHPPPARAPVRSVDRVLTRGKPIVATRPFAGGPIPRPYRTPDHRFARPSIAWLRHHPRALHPPPVRWHYRPYYARWWVHPWWRFRYVTVAVVAFSVTVSPWVVEWAPPAPAGWVWVPGHWVGAVWVPGHWQPVAPAPRGYDYVPGWWMGPVYVEGYWRLRRRRGWVWVDVVYLEDGSCRWPHWRPDLQPPPGYTWEPGFWDGELWVDGFWRPEHRAGFTWVEAWYSEEGLFHAGYWYPLEEREGHVWVPGWFDGNDWVEGYWVSDEEYEGTDVESWEPEEGWDDGWEEEDAGQVSPEAPDPPLALPVEI